jgi:hypothetical protein
MLFHVYHDHGVILHTTEGVVVVYTSDLFNDGQRTIDSHNVSGQTRSIEPAILYLGTPVVPASAL